VSKLIKGSLEDAVQDSEAQNLAVGIDIVGDIAIARFEEADKALKRNAAEAIMDKMKNVKAVFEQAGGIEGEFRLRRLEHLAGEERTTTVHRENGCSFRVDVERCYFSPRLSTERQRLSEQTGEGERVLNMFAGVGPFSILLAKRRRAEVVSCELNRTACILHAQNNRLNKVAELVEVINADAGLLPAIVREKFQRIIMQHPSRADAFAAQAVALADRGCTIHYYRHVLGVDESEAGERLAAEVERLFPGASVYSVRRVREVGPRWLEMVADVRLP
jgi:tRNA (guanine37-N1)-methyltransferase